MRRLTLNRRTALVTVMGLLAAGAATLAPSALAHGGEDECPNELACGTPLKIALDQEKKANDAFNKYGYMTELSYKTAAQKPGDLAGQYAYYDSGLWTGVYMGGESMRYATAKKHLAEKGIDSEERAFWTAQRNEAYARVKAMVEMYDRNINIAADWKTSLKVPPAINPDPVHQVDLGRGLVQGEPGMIMRACMPTNTKDGFGIPQDKYDENRTVGPFKWKDGKTYNCAGSPSRDTYAGTTFGLLTAFDLVSVDNPAMRHSISKNVMAMTNFLFKYGWTYPRPWGYISTRHDFDLLISPLMTYVPMAQLNMANASRHVADLDGTSADKLKYDAIWKATFASEIGQLATSFQIDANPVDDSYYKWNLHHLTAFNLMRTTTGVERQLIGNAFKVVDDTVGNDLNAHFEAIMYAITGEREHLDDAIDYLGQWMSYRKNISGGKKVDNTKFCGGGACAKPLPISKRPPTDFVWQRSPRTDINGSTPATDRAPGIDYMTPYWMLRYEMEVAHPALTPL